VYACVFSQHLYSPLFRDHDFLRITPMTLNPGEYRFVLHMIDYWKKQPAAFFKDGKPYRELYLLRNLVRRGIGFPIEAGSFYPDFLLWIVDGDTQYITFLDPHGMGREDLGSDKVNLFRRLKDEIEPKLPDQHVKLNSFIISTTSQHSLAKNPREYTERHVIFPEDTGRYIDEMVTTILMPDKAAATPIPT
jgi:hypothetical protein